MSRVERARRILGPLSPLYALGVAARNALYDRSLAPVHALSGPVVSVGNLTSGGTGKSPLVRLVSSRIAALGRRPAILLRGYGSDGALEVVPPWRDVPPPGGLDRFGDEALEHVRALGADVVVVAHPDRVRGAALARSAGANVFVLDDGFQHRRVKRDLDLVCLDAAHPLGTGSMLPRGDLREGVAALARCDLVMWTRAGRGFSPPENPAAARNLPFVAWAYRAAGIRAAGGSGPLRAGRVVMAPSVARPDSVALGTLELGLEIVGSRPGRDHARYGEARVLGLERLLSRERADALVITAKDEPRFLATPRGRSLAALGRVGILEMQLEPVSDPAPFAAALDAILGVR